MFTQNEIYLFAFVILLSIVFVLYVARERVRFKLNLQHAVKEQLHKLLNDKSDEEFECIDSLIKHYRNKNSSGWFKKQLNQIEDIELPSSLKGFDKKELDYLVDVFKTKMDDIRSTPLTIGKE
jgi:hypothetical protein